jgi:hypothetical protein
MPALARLLLVFAALLLGPLIVMADELPANPREIQRLTPEQAKKLAAEFKGILLSLNGLTTLDADTAKALAEFEGVRLLLSGLTTLAADTAKALAGSKASWDGRLSKLTTLDADTAKVLAGLESVALPGDVLASFFQKNPLTPETALVWAALSGGRLTGVTAIDAPDSVAIAKALATRTGPLSLPSLKRISPKTLTALIEKQDVEIPLVETLELIPEPDGSLTEDFVIPERFQEQQRAMQGAK